MWTRRRRRRFIRLTAPSAPSCDARTIATIAAIVFAALLILAGLTLLGRAYTFDGKVLSHLDWRVLQAEAAYRAELGRLQADVEALADLVNAEVAEPVRGQLAAEQIAQRWNQGEPALGVPRQKLIEAAQAVRDWSIGAIPREPARAAVDAAIASLVEAGKAQHGSRPRGGQ